jgi:hypothetical protein
MSGTLIFNQNLFLYKSLKRNLAWNDGLLLPVLLSYLDAAQCQSSKTSNDYSRLISIARQGSSSQYVPQVTTKSIITTLNLERFQFRLNIVELN